jgi:hypothetical protein
VLSSGIECHLLPAGRPRHGHDRRQHPDPIIRLGAMKARMPPGAAGQLTGSQRHRILASRGTGKHQRLSQITAKYDPASLFHLNTSTRPATE